jgi:SNF2 family DNA or RNA helicase
MIEPNWARCKTEPFPLTDHQKDGVRELVNDTNLATGRTIPKVFALFDDPGTSKTRQVIEAACFLHEAGRVDTVLVLAPDAVCSVWTSADPAIGEVAQWAWRPWAGHRYHAKAPALPPPDGRLHFVATNFEFIQSGERKNQPPANKRLASLMEQLRGRKVWIVVDESSRIKTHNSNTTKAARKLRARCSRATILNGSPAPNGVIDLYSQIAFLDDRIMGLESVHHFKARHCKMGGYGGKAIVGYHDLDELNARLAPYILRRTIDQCTQLPPRVYQAREVPLSRESWRIYREMRDGMVAWLDGAPQSMAVARQACVKVLRLSQITSGLLGGIEEIEGDDSLNFDAPDLAWEELVAAAGKGPAAVAEETRPKYEPPRVIGSEKLDDFLEWFEEWRRANPNDNLVVWGRFRAELDRARDAVANLGVRVVEIRGGQKKSEREEAVKVFSNKRGSETIALFGSPQAGGLGLTLVEAADACYLSTDFNLLTREQSEARTRRRGQKRTTRFTDWLATGPDGQRTVDHRIIKALRAKEDLAKLTTKDWRRALTEE